MHPVVVGETDLLRRILQARWRQQGAQAHLQRSLRGAGGAVAGSNRGERREGENEGGPGGRQRRDGGPVRRGHGRVENATAL